jgi:hypothetical protein
MGMKVRSMSVERRTWRMKLRGSEEGDKKDEREQA